MRLVFFNNYLNHHQVFVADALYKLLADEYIFVATMPVNPSLLKGGNDYSTTRPYCLRAYEGGSQLEMARSLAQDADVCVFGADSQEYAKLRAIEIRSNSEGQKLSFEFAERWLKRGFINLASPRLLKWLINYHIYYKKVGFYRLCASAFTKKDDSILGAYKDRSFKWGYFTKVNESGEFQSINQESPIRIMWCGRFLKWKHPELPIILAKRLKEKGYAFFIEMYGDEGNATKYESTFSKKRLEILIEDLGVNDCVKLMGNRPNEEILLAMKNSDIFLFTSDKREGWGAVANESMTNGCALVASDLIGSVPFLVQDGNNGLVFKNCDIDSLTEKLEWLILHPKERLEIQKNATKCMFDLWSPSVAAENLLTLIDCILRNMDTTIQVGPCSKA